MYKRSSRTDEDKKMREKRKESCTIPHESCHPEEKMWKNCDATPLSATPSSPACRRCCTKMYRQKHVIAAEFTDRSATGTQINRRDCPCLRQANQQRHQHGTDPVCVCENRHTYTYRPSMYKIYPARCTKDVPFCTKRVSKEQNKRTSFRHHHVRK